MTGVDDVLDDGDVAYTIVTAAATSTDTVYNGINAADVAVTNTDNDACGHHGQRRSPGLTTTEAGGIGDLHGRAEFAADRRRRPSALSSVTLTEGTVPASVTFTTANWNTAQTVTVTGVNDDLDDGDVAYTHRHGGGDQRRRDLQRDQRGRRRGHQHRQRRLGHHR